MTRALKWFYMLTKRLYKKAAFIVILALILASVIVFAFAAKSDSGFVRIALTEEGAGDKISEEIIDELLRDDSMLMYARFDSPADAVAAVRSGKVDVAWIFPENMGDSPADYSLLSDGTVKVVEREQNVVTRLAREKLNAVLFDYTARAFYLSYIDEKLPELDSLGDEELLAYFENAVIDDELFVFDNPESSSLGEADYLTAPLRGLLGIIIVLGGLAGALYYMKDEEKGLFANIPLNRQPLIAFVCIVTATLNISLVCLLALFASGLYAFSLTELACALLYAVATASFCMLLKEIFGSIKSLGGVIPAVIILLSVVCPVFFNFKAARAFSFIFPPTYYINVTFSAKYLLYMAGYSLICLALTAGLGWAKSTAMSSQKLLSEINNT